MTQKAKERAEAISWLRERVKPGDTIYTVLRHVSRSGMSRRIDLFKLDCQDGKPVKLWLSGMASRAGLGSMARDCNGIRVDGCGMDMGFHVVYNLSVTLFCEPGKYDHDSAYSLRHEWL